MCVCVLVCVCVCVCYQSGHWDIDFFFQFEICIKLHIFKEIAIHIFFASKNLLRAFITAERILFVGNIYSVSQK